MGSLEMLKKKCFAYLHETFGEDGTIVTYTKDGERVETPMDSLLTSLLSMIDERQAEALLYLDKTTGAGKDGPISMERQELTARPETVPAALVAFSLLSSNGEKVHNIIANALKDVTPGNDTLLFTGIQQALAGEKTPLFLEYVSNAEPVEAIMRFLISPLYHKKESEKKKKPLPSSVQNIKDADEQKNKDTFIYVDDGTNVRTIITVADFSKYFLRRIVKGSKIFKFVLSKATQQHTSQPQFNLAELVDLGIYNDTRTAYEGLKNTIIPKMGKINILIEKKNKKTGSTVEDGFIFSPVFGESAVYKDKCKITVSSALFFAAQTYFTVFPRWAYSMTDDAFSLLDYIFYLARQNTVELKENGYFDIKLDTIRQRMGLPSPNEERRQADKILKPMNDALEAIEDAQLAVDDKIVYFELQCEDYRDARTFLQGKLRVKIEGKALDYMLLRERERQKAIAEQEKLTEAPAAKKRRGRKKKTEQQ